MFKSAPYFTTQQQQTILAEYEFLDKEQFYLKLKELGCFVESIRVDHEWAYANHYCRYVKWGICIRDFSMLDILLIDEEGRRYGSSRVWNYDLLPGIKEQRGQSS